MKTREPSVSSSHGENSFEDEDGNSSDQQKENHSNKGRRGGRKSRESMEPNGEPITREEAAKRRRRRERNKEAAARCRQKRLTRMTELQLELDAERAKVAELRAQLEVARKNEQTLVSALSHPNCELGGDRQQQQMISRMQNNFQNEESVQMQKNKNETFVNANLYNNYPLDNEIGQSSSNMFAACNKRKHLPSDSKIEIKHGPVSAKPQINNNCNGYVVDKKVCLNGDIRKPTLDFIENNDLGFSIVSPVEVATPLKRPDFLRLDNGFTSGTRRLMETPFDLETPGTYAEVKLVGNKENGVAALKVFKERKEYHDNGKGLYEKEYHILQCLTGNANIIKTWGKYEGTQGFGIFLEYANEGCLIVIIEPDVGMNPTDARNYFFDLMNGLSYIHAQGIVHRDLKPENCLINDKVLKIADFGLSTEYMSNGEEKLLHERVGSLNYMSVEIFQPPYRGPPNDIWACGIVFFAMLTGKLPWQKAETSDKRFHNFVTGQQFSQDIYATQKVPLEALSLILEMLTLNPNRRATLKKIKDHRYVTDHRIEVTNNNGGNLRNSHISRLMKMEGGHAAYSCSIPVKAECRAIEPPRKEIFNPFQTQRILDNSLNLKKNYALSQPIHDKYALESDDEGVLKDVNEQKRIFESRGTRFLVNADRTTFLTGAIEYFKNMSANAFQHTIEDSTTIKFSCNVNDESLIFQMRTFKVDNFKENVTLVHFRRLRGSGFVFLSIFKDVKNALVNCIREESDDLYAA
uniref:Protein kinase domain-containing protein n=1 Tax=Rhabditophanes sp. KR3021 TaxID=114890 RepID=A0AC35TSU6_9BILA